VSGRLGKPGRARGRIIIDPDGTRAEVVNVAVEAHKMRLRGMAWAEIGARCGYKSPQGAQTAVMTMLVRAAREMDARHRSAQLALEVQRLDAIQDAYWSAAIDGNVFAAQLILRIIDSRVKLLRLTEATPDAVGAGPATLIVTGPSEDYVAGLRRIVAVSQSDDETG
jgi:hypothetical protein